MKTETKARSVKALQSKSFKPIVAGSLALFLAAGIANANCPTTGGGSSPAICYGDNATSLTDKTSTFTDLKFEETSGSGFVIPQHDKASGGTNLLFKFNTSTTAGSGTASNPSGSFADGTYTISSGDDDKKEQHFKLDGGQKAIQMGTDGNGKLSVDFGAGENKRSFTLNLGQVTHQGFAFKGNIEVVAGGESDNKEGSEFNATFGKDMQGNITIGENALWGSDITFTNGAKFDGSFSAESGANIITFEGDGTITGGLSAKKRVTGNLVDFRGTTNKIDGDILAEEEGVNYIATSNSGIKPPGAQPKPNASLTIGGNVTANEGGNVIVVGQDLTIGGSVAAVGENQDTKPDTGNVLNAKNITINGGISATGKENKNQADDLNLITAKEKLTIKAKVFRDGDATAPAARNILATKGGTNTLKAKKVDIDVDTISAEGEHSSNTIGDDKTSGTIKAGSIKASTKGQNTITFGGAAASTITAGTITADNEGVNNITLDKGSLTAGGISADGEGSTNLIFLGGNSATKLISNGSITASNDATNALFVEEGAFIFKPTTAKNTLGLIAESKGNNDIKARGAEINVDTISADGEGGNRVAASRKANVTAKSLIAQGGGSNSLATGTLTANIDTISATGEGSANDIGAVSDKSTLVTKSISATDGGSNTIALDGNTAGTVITSTGSIIATNGGTNTLEAENGTIKVGKIKKDGESLDISIAAENGKNNIAAKFLNINVDTISANGAEDATLDKSANVILANGNKGTIAVNSVSAANGSNILTLRGHNGSSITINGNLEANRGINALKIEKGKQGTPSTTNPVGTITIGKEGSNSSIIARSGLNDISVGKLTINVDVISATGDSEATGKNVLSAADESNITAKAISATKGTNQIRLAGTKPNTLTADIIAGEKGINNVILNGFWTSGGTLTTKNGGVNNLVFRAQDSTPPTTPTSYNYNINTTGGEANLILQRITDVTANINYGSKGITTLIFAHDGSGVDSFEADATDINSNKILGKTYGNGLKVTLADKKVVVNGKEDQSFLDAYKGDLKSENPTLLTLTTSLDKTKKQGSVDITGLAVGNFEELFDKATQTQEVTTYDFNINENSALAGSIEVDANTTLNVNMQEGSKLLIDNQKQRITNLTLSDALFDDAQAAFSTLAQQNTVIDLATLGNEVGRKDFRLLTIGEQGKDDTGMSGDNALFKVYMNNKAPQTGSATLGGIQAGKSGAYGHAYSDRVLIFAGSGSTNYLQVVADDSSDLSRVRYRGGGTEVQGNIAVATVKTDTGITFEAKDHLLGYDVVGTELTANNETDENGQKKTGGEYTTYFVKSMDNQGASLANQKAAVAALGTNYDLYLANLNSLNKRMGELRENANGQGVWARVFNGMQTTKFALDTTSLYTTIQAGYDYAFGSKGANNYLGFALSYANSLGYSDNTIDINGVGKGLRNTNSNAVEFALYNAYVQDGASKDTGWANGFYSDSILKFSYIMSSLTFLDQIEKAYDTNNFALTLSQELGYRFLLGSNKAFYIDPQVEFTLGFLSQSNLKQQLGNHFMDSVQDSVLTLRSRVGSSFGYKFDQFTENKGFKASLYLGTYFVGDLINGGDISILTDSGKGIELKPLASTARFVMNVGTNFKIKDNTRIYFDFEKSFGGSIITNYQINLGVRYSFGTSAYASYNEIATQENKNNSTIKEVEPTKGFYVKLLEKEENKLSSKEVKILKNLKEELRVQAKTENNKAMKVYLAGPYKDEAKAKEAKRNLEGALKELKGKGNIVEVEDSKPVEERDASEISTNESNED